MKILASSHPQRDKFFRLSELSKKFSKATDALEDAVSLASKYNKEYEDLPDFISTKDLEKLNSAMSTLYDVTYALAHTGFWEDEQ